MGSNLWKLRELATLSAKLENDNWLVVLQFSMQFTIRRQRRSRQVASTGDNATDGAKSIAIYALRQRLSRPVATSGDNSRQRNRQSREINCKLYQDSAVVDNNSRLRNRQSMQIKTKTEAQPTSGDRQQPTT